MVLKIWISEVESEWSATISWYVPIVVAQVCAFQVMLVATICTDAQPIFLQLQRIYSKSTSREMLITMTITNFPTMSFEEGHSYSGSKLFHHIKAGYVARLMCWTYTSWNGWRRLGSVVFAPNMMWPTLLTWFSFRKPYITHSVFSQSSNSIAENLISSWSCALEFQNPRKLLEVSWFQEKIQLQDIYTNPK